MNGFLQANLTPPVLYVQLGQTATGHVNVSLDESIFADSGQWALPPPTTTMDSPPPSSTAVTTPTVGTAVNLKRLDSDSDALKSGESGESSGMSHKTKLGGSDPDNEALPKSAETQLYVFTAGNNSTKRSQVSARGWTPDLVKRETAHIGPEVQFKNLQRNEKWCVKKKFGVSGDMG